FGFGLFLAVLVPSVLATYRWRAPARVLFVAGAMLLRVTGVEKGLLKCKLLESCHPRFLVAKAAAPGGRDLDILRQPGGWRNGLHQERARLAGAYALPRIKACVRDAPVDLISYEQGLVFLNQFHWRPRPVFQSYTAYTPYLLSANARFFQGPKAPAYLI